jgi:Rrf2 family protein
MVYLVQRGEGGAVPRHGIAERQQISADYVAQLFRNLQSAELVQGMKGLGGYRLARDASQITAGDVIHAVEGRIAVVRCALPGPGGEPACNRMDRCMTHLLWKRLSEASANSLGSITLQDLADQAQQLNSEAL